MRGSIHQLSEMLSNRAVVVTNTTFSWSSWLFPFCLFFYFLWALKIQGTFLLAGPTLYFRPFCTHFVLILLFKHILLRSISLFRLLFKSIFSFCLKKKVRSILKEEFHGGECLSKTQTTSADFPLTDHDQSFWLSLLSILWSSSPSCLSAETRSSPLVSCLERTVAEENLHHCHWLIHSLWSPPDFSCRLNVSHWN
jgi:hypothetical protein